AREGGKTTEPGSRWKSASLIHAAAQKPNGLQILLDRRIYVAMLQHLLRIGPDTEIRPFGRDGGPTMRDARRDDGDVADIHFAGDKIADDLSTARRAIEY